jgi:hypothetical protein
VKNTERVLQGGVKVKIKVKGNGQECPFYTCSCPSPFVALLGDSRFLTGLGARFGMTMSYGGFLQPALVQEVLPIQRIPLRRPEAGVADDAAEFFFGRAVGHACGSYYVFFQHHRAYVVASEAQAHLADF